MYTHMYTYTQIYTVYVCTVYIYISVCVLAVLFDDLKVDCSKPNPMHFWSVTLRLKRFRFLKFQSSAKFFYFILDLAF